MRKKKKQMTDEERYALVQKINADLARQTKEKRECLDRMYERASKARNCAGSKESAKKDFVCDNKTCPYNGLHMCGWDCTEMIIDDLWMSAKGYKMLLDGKEDSD